jgi:hypothetical protein
MPFAEIANALFLTYVATEYHFVSEGSRSFQQAVQSRANRVALALVVCINLFDRLTGAATLVNELMRDLFHFPKILLAAILYVATLYADCLRIQRTLTALNYFKRVGIAFLKVAPWYPFLAVVISFGFLFVISIWEALRLPLEWLNMPIYYGTLYGPFSMVYFNVKRKIMEEKEFLPSTQLEREYIPSSQNKALQAALKRQYNMS